MNTPRCDYCGKFCRQFIIEDALSSDGGPPEQLLVCDSCQAETTGQRQKERSKMVDINDDNS